MVKAVVGEETRLNSVEERLSRSAIPAQVGLVIGKLSTALDRGFVFDLIPTPSNDAGEPACSFTEVMDDRKKSSRSKAQSLDASSLSIDSEWVAEHARQVSRMLLGGMKVVGIYIWASESAYKNSIMELCKAIKGFTEATRHLDAKLDEALLIHICYSPRRWNCRSCSLASSITSSSLRPCDFKLGRVLSSLQRFKCNYSFNLRLPIFHEGQLNPQTFTDILRQELAIHAKELRSASAMIDGDLHVDNDEPSNTDGEHKVELLFPFMKDAGAEAFSAEDVAGILLFSGSMYSYTYLNAKEPVSQAVTDIKADIMRSLQSRLDIICDEAEEDLNPTDGGDKEAAGEMSEKPISKLVLSLSTKPYRLLLPRRVLVPWLADTFICDYLQPSESLEVLKDHCTELMSMENLPDASKISEVEAEAPSLMPISFWDAVSISPSSYAANSLSERKAKELGRGYNGQKTGNTFNFGILAAFFFLVLAIILGLVFYDRG